MRRCFCFKQNVFFAFITEMASTQSSGGSRRPKQELTDDLSNVEFETSEDVEVIPSFDSLSLREDLLRGIYAYGMNHSNNALFSYFSLNIFKLKTYLRL